LFEGKMPSHDKKPGAGEAYKKTVASKLQLKGHVMKGSGKQYAAED
jgi:hypothetical protein